MISLQTRLKALVDKYTPSGWYSAYALDSEEHIGTFDVPVEKGDVKLHKARYGLLPSVLGIHLAAAKRHPETGQLHDVTRRKVPKTHAEKARTDEHVKGTDLEDYEYERLQFHVHLFERDDGTTDVCSHLELRSDLHPVGTEDWSEAIGRLMIHYSPKHESQYLEGDSEPELEQLL